MCLVRHIAFTLLVLSLWISCYGLSWVLGVIGVDLLLVFVVLLARWFEMRAVLDVALWISSVSMFLISVTLLLVCVPS